MIQSLLSWKAQKRGWAMLNALHPASIDLERVALVRERSLDDLSNYDQVASLLLQLGLNDEGMNEFPPHLHIYCGRGLRLWQYPNQFSKYLVHLSKLKIKSYLEIGVRHGGSFVVTTEYLSRFASLDKCLAVDVIPCPSLVEYERINRQAAFYRRNTQSASFNQFIQENGPFDLAFIDSHHEEIQCRCEFLSIKDHASIIALHDISNVNCPGVANVWREIKANKEYTCFEYIDQYEDRGPYMGIGLAIKHPLPPTLG